MRVIQTIQSTDPFDTGRVEPPQEVIYYNGSSLVAAMAAMVSATASVGQDERWFRVLSVTLIVSEPEN